MLGRAPTVAATLAMSVTPAPSGAQTLDLAAVGATATAQGVRTSLTMPGFLVVESVFDSGGPVSQAVLDFSGGTAFASLPYPGETAMSVPGLIAAGGGPTLPAYPLYVAAGSGQPDAAMADPAGLYALRAVLSPTGATADARLGSHGQAVVSGVQTHAMVTRTADVVSAAAESITEGIAVAEGAVTIGSVRSRSVTSSSEAGPQTTSELIVEGGRAGPLAFSYGAHGLVVNGGSVPIPSDSALATLNQVLAPAGVSLGVVRGAELPGGRSSDVLLVDQQRRLPTGQSAMLRLQFGGTFTAVSGTPLAAGLRAGPFAEPVPATPSSEPEESAGESAGSQVALASGPDPNPSAPPPSRLQSEPASAEVAAGAPALEGLPLTSGAPIGHAVDAIGVTGVRVTALRVAYWALALFAGGIVFTSWWWRRGAQRP